MSYFIGFDVGTGVGLHKEKEKSARAALVDENGEILAESTYATQTRRDDKDAHIFEQSTQDIWRCISQASKDVLAASKIPNTKVRGIGFDATCSLAVADFEGTPVSVTPGNFGVTTSDKDTWNVVLWADHRAEAEANLINSTGSNVLKYVGGTMSLEMEMPKILWLKKHMPAEVFKNSTFFDLPDFLTYLATGNAARSNCSLACKCSYVPPGVDGSQGWNAQLLQTIGLGELDDTKYKQLGGQPGDGGLILTAGQPVGHGLSAEAAAELGLVEGTAVGSGVIDAYAGWVGTVAAPMQGDKDPSLESSKHRLAAIAGTSTCHIVQSSDPVFVPGVWGPYKHAIFPNAWMNEGGQSSTGQLLDFMVETHPAFAKVSELAKSQGKHHFQLLAEMLQTMADDQKAPFLPWLTRNLFLYPDLHGNRSPIADPRMRGVLIGLALDKTANDLALRYLATCEAIAIQTKHIVDTMNGKGHQITSIFMSGGLAKNSILMQLMADVCDMPVQLPFSTSASVVLGSAMLGAIAAKEAGIGDPILTQEVAEKRSNAMQEDLWSIMVQMSRPGSTVRPKAGEKEKKLLAVKYAVFQESIALQQRIRKDVAEALA